MQDVSGMCKIEQVHPGHLYKDVDRVPCCVVVGHYLKLLSLYLAQASGFDSQRHPI